MAISRKWMQRFTMMLMAIFFVSNLFAAQPVLLTGMRIQPSPNKTRFIFMLNKKPRGRVQYFLRPYRVVVELSNTQKNFTIQNAKLLGANVTSIHTESTKGLLRFIFNTTGKVNFKINFLSVNGKIEMQLDIISEAVLPKKIATFNHDDILQEFSKKINQAVLKKQIKSQFIQKPHIFTIVIDPGHGGRDPGAISKSGVKEKDVVLAIAKKLANQINQSPQMHAFLTRNADYFVPLRKRLELARKNEADLFIAVHADAYFNDDAMGASVYALSSRGATSEAARWLAQRDNYSELDGIELDGLQDRSVMLRSVLIDLAQTSTIQESIEVGNAILRALAKVSALHYKRVELAPFVVLKSPDTPSILVETGFLSNNIEAARLTDPLYQTKIAQALEKGIEEYVREFRVKNAEWIKNNPNRLSFWQKMQQYLHLRA